MLPKVKSWRDTGETPYRKNHGGEIKLCLLHTTTLNWESRRVPVLPPDASSQTASEEADHKVS
jgi:hypothetical protein